MEGSMGEAKRIRILAGEVSASAELNESKTASAIWDALPIQARASTWGDEIYFTIPVKLGDENGQEVVELRAAGVDRPEPAWAAAKARWLSLIMAASYNPRRWFQPPPHRTAYFSSRRQPGVVLRVS